MTEKLLESLINEILDELTARPGPRTGAFYFPPELIDSIANQAIKRYQEIKAGIKPDVLKTKVVVPSPITGKPYKVPVWYYWDPGAGKEAGSMTPYDRGTKGKVSLNVAYAYDLPFLRSIVYHELVHLFDPQLMKGITPDNAEAANDTTKDEYWQSPREKKAFLHQTISEMDLLAKKLAARVAQGHAPETVLAKSMQKKPWMLVRHALNVNPELRKIIKDYEKDQEFMKGLYKAAYDIMVAVVEPSLQPRT